MNILKESLKEHIDTIKTLSVLSRDIDSLANAAIETIKSGNKILIMGNGGSAGDSQHLAAEIAVRYKKNRAALPAIALGTDTSMLTATANDFSFDRIFSRQIEAIANQNDLVIGISTSGKSKNIIEGLKAAKAKGCLTAGLLGNSGGNALPLLDYPVVVASDNTPRIQECHIFIIHLLSEIIEDAFNDQ